MVINIKGQVEKVNGKELSYSQFVERYMEKNQPVVLTGLMDHHHWRASTDWVTPHGRPNFQFFFNHYGTSKVQVADCDTREFTDQKREDMLVSDFIRRCLQLEGSAVSCDNENGASNGHYLSVPYLKDWHFVKEYPEYVAYITPIFFRDDWLNLYLDNFRMHTDPDANQQNEEICCSDYRFVYMGVKGSWTPLHADVFRSYSWSANVCGKKRWLFLDPSQCHLVFDRNMKNCVYNIFDEEVLNAKFPDFNKATWLECTQDAGEIIFVPSGWFHQVHNLEDTISINHNWFNAYNLSWVWNLLLRDYNEAREYIEDIKDVCDEFEGICQRNLAANTGMNFYDFFTFMSYFTLANLVLLRYINGGCGTTTRSLSKVSRHLSMNLWCIRKIALEMKDVHALEGNRDCVVDMIKAFEEPRFSKLCINLGRTYVTIHAQSYLASDFESTSTSDLVDLNVVEAYTYSQIYAPEDLIKFIDKAVAELGESCIEPTVL